MREPSDVTARAAQRGMPMTVESSGLEKELSEIRREVIESRNLVIKTDNQLKNVHSEVKALAKWQVDAQRKSWISSGVAYALFAVLAGVCAWLVSSARVSSVKADREAATRKVTALESKLHQVDSEKARSAQAQQRAEAVYRTLSEGQGADRLAGVRALAKLDLSELPPLEQKTLKDRADQVRQELGNAAFDAGTQAFRKGDMKTAAENLSRYESLGLPFDSDQATAAALYLGIAQNKLGHHQEAITQLSRFVKASPKAKSRDYALALLADSYQQMHHYQEAIDTAKAGLAAYPHSQFAASFRHRIRSAQAEQATAH